MCFPNIGLVSEDRGTIKQEMASLVDVKVVISTRAIIDLPFNQEEEGNNFPTLCCVLSSHVRLCHIYLVTKEQ